MQLTGQFKHRSNIKGNKTMHQIGLKLKLKDVGPEWEKNKL